MLGVKRKSGHSKLVVLGQRDEALRAVGIVFIHARQLLLRPNASLSVRALGHLVQGGPVPAANCVPPLRHRTSFEQGFQHAVWSLLSSKQEGRTRSRHHALDVFDFRQRLPYGVRVIGFGGGPECL